MGIENDIAWLNQFTAAAKAATGAVNTLVGAADGKRDGLNALVGTMRGSGGSAAGGASSGGAAAGTGGSAPAVAAPTSGFGASRGGTGVSMEAIQGYVEEYAYEMAHGQMASRLIELENAYNYLQGPSVYGDIRSAAKKYFPSVGPASRTGAGASTTPAASAPAASTSTTGSPFGAQRGGQGVSLESIQGYIEEYAYEMAHGQHADRLIALENTYNYLQGPSVYGDIRSAAKKYFPSAPPASSTRPAASSSPAASGGAGAVGGPGVASGKIMLGGGAVSLPAATGTGSGLTGGPDIVPAQTGPTTITLQTPTLADAVKRLEAAIVLLGNGKAGGKAPTPPSGQAGPGGKGGAGAPPSLSTAFYQGSIP